MSLRNASDEYFDWFDGCWHYTKKQQLTVNMSTGENINANGSQLTAAIVRLGFQKFPQCTVAAINPAQWPEVAPIQTAAGYPFTAFESAVVPRGEVWFIGTAGELLGRIINVV